MPHHPKTPTEAETAWCLEALREVKAGAELSRASRARLQDFGLLDGLGQPTPAGRALLAAQQAACDHSAGWRAYTAKTKKCRACGIVRAFPEPERPMTMAELERFMGASETEALQARITQLEAALKPFAEEGVSLAEHYAMNGWPVPAKVLPFIAAAQALGMLDPEPEGVRAEVGLG